MNQQPRTTYLPLHLLIDQDAETRRYFVRILPPAPALTSFPDAMYPLRLEDPLPCFVSDLVDEIEAAVQKGDDLSAAGPTFGQIEQCGEWIDAKLAEVALPLRDSLVASLNVRNKDRSLGLLIRLHFAEHAAELAKLVWETWKSKLGDGHPFLLQRPWVSLVRFVPNQGGKRNTDPLDRPLKLLVVTCSYDVEGNYDEKLASYIRLDRESLEQSLGELLDQGILEMSHLPDPTVKELEQELKEVDIYHHLGHGGSQERGGAYLMLKDAKLTRGRKIFWHDLRNCFESYNAPYLKLAVLNACELQKAGFGEQLARLGVPAVVAMQAEIATSVIADRGFTQELYTHLAAGEPIHSAFSRARASIAAQDSCVEAFIPVLVLSTFDEVAFQHPNLEKARAVAQQREREQDPHKQLWDEACSLEERDQWSEALERFREIAGKQPDYPGVQERIAVLETRIERQRRIDQLIEQLQRASRERALIPLQSLLRDIGPLAADPALSAALESALQDLDEELERLSDEERWQEARELLVLLRGMSSLLPAERRPVLSDQAVKTFNQTFEQIRVFSAAEAGEDPDEEEMPPSERPAAKVHRFAEMGDWSKVKELAREMLRLDPQDPEAAKLLEQALTQDIEELCRAKRWREAEARCRELIELTSRHETWELLSRILLDWAEDAKRRHDWESAREVGQRILNDPNLKRLNRKAREIQQEADESLRVLKRIRLL